MKQNLRIDIGDTVTWAGGIYVGTVRYFSSNYEKAYVRGYDGEFYTVEVVKLQKIARQKVA